MKKNQSLVSKIRKYIETNKTFTLQELYAKFGDNYQKHSIRARVYDVEKEDASVIRTGRGSFALVGAEIEATIECVDSKKEIFKIAESKIKYDLVFLDIPYSTGGQKGGNRNLASYDLISPDEFKEIIKEVEKVLRNEDSQVYFMIAGGKSSIKQSNKYINMFNETSLKQCDSGGYTKLTKSGAVCNMGKYKMPPELILSFSKSGKIVNLADEYSMDFRIQRPPLPRSGGYPTEKPLTLMHHILKQSTRIGDRVLELFAGSGVMVEASIELGRKINAYDFSMKAITNHILPRLMKFSNENNYLKFQPSLM